MTDTDEITRSQAVRWLLAILCWRLGFKFVQAWPLARVGHRATRSGVPPSLIFRPHRAE